MQFSPESQLLPAQQLCPLAPQEGGWEAALQLTVFPYIVVNIGGVAALISIAISAPVSAAVAHTFALARVSAPIIWPEA